MSEGNSRKYPEMGLTDLKRAIDSPAGLDPVPVEHIEFPSKYPKRITKAVTEFMSVIYGKTVRNGHRSPVAVHPGGNKLFTLKDVQEDRKWTEDWTQRVFRRACIDGLVRPGRGKGDYFPTGIVLTGRVNPKEIQEDTSPKEIGHTECTLRANLSNFEYQQYEKLPEEVRTRFEEVELREIKVDDRIEADAIRLARHVNAERHRERLSQFGIIPSPPPEKRYDRDPVLELKLLPEQLEAAASNVPTDAPVRSVHSEAAPPEPATYTGANTPVYTGFSSPPHPYVAFQRFFFQRLN